MRLGLVAAGLLGLAMFGAAAQAQDNPIAVAQGAPSPYRNDMGLYVQPVFSFIHNSEADTGSFAFLGEGKNSQWFRGAALGFQDEFYHAGANNFGFDMRLNFQRGNDAAMDTFLVGLRYSRTTDGKLRPFAELLGGVGGTSSPFNAHRVTRPMFQVSVGADYPVFKHLDWRVAEVSYGQVRTIGADAFLGTDVHNRPAAQVIGIGSGLVVRF